MKYIDRIFIAIIFAGAFTTVMFGVLLVGFLRERTLDVFTLDDLYKKGITNYVDQTVLLKTKVGWVYGSGSFVLDIPDNVEEGIIWKKTILPRYLTAIFDNIDLYIDEKDKDKFIGWRNRANFFITSDKLLIVKDSEGKEFFSFNGSILSNNNSFYILKGKLHYREWQSGSDKNDPRLIAQNNNPLYWAQIFQFDLIDIAELTE